MTAKLRHVARPGLVLALICAAVLEAGAQGPGAKPADLCGLLTAEEAAAVLGAAVEAPKMASSSVCGYRKQSATTDDIMLQVVPVRFKSAKDFHAFLVEDTDNLNQAMKTRAGDGFEPTTVDPVPEVGQPAYYVDPQLLILKDGRVLGIIAADRKQATAVAAKAVPRF